MKKLMGEKRASGVKKQFKTIDEYIGAFPKDVQGVLERMRQTIKGAAPCAVEVISYLIPAFDLNGKHLVFFAGWKSHVSIYPVPLGNEAFRKELSPYKGGKGTVRFPLDRPIPYDLVRRIVLFRVKETLGKKKY